MSKNIYVKRTNYSNSISFGENEIIKMLEADEVHAVSQTTGQLLDVLDPQQVVSEGKQLPRVDKHTGEFKGWSYYRVFNF